MIVQPTSTTFSSSTFAQDRTESHPEPAIKSRKRPFVTVFEIFKPASERLVHIRDDAFQTLSVGPFCLLPQRVLELLQ